MVKRWRFGLERNSVLGDLTESWRRTAAMATKSATMATAAAAIDAEAKAIDVYRTMRMRRRRAAIWHVAS